MKIITRVIAAMAVAAPLGAANAADIEAVGYDWSGAYVGVQAGYLWGDVDIKNRLANGAINAQSTPDVEGFLAGAHIGYNHQMSNVVIGLEADFNFTGADSGGFETALNAGGAPIAPNQHKADLDWTASTRLRVGMPVDNVMPYLTGGLALAGADFALDHVGDDGVLSDTMLGWTAGGGIEWAISQSLTTRVEYRYSDYGSASGHVFPLFPTEKAKADLSSHQVTVGLSFKF